MNNKLNTNQTNVYLYVGDKEFGHATFDFKATQRSVLKKILAYAVTVFKQVYLQPTLLSYSINVTNDLTPSRVLAYFSVAPLPGIEAYALQQLQGEPKQNILGNSTIVPVGVSTIKPTVMKTGRKYTRRIKQTDSPVPVQEHRIKKQELTNQTLDSMLKSTGHEYATRQKCTRKIVKSITTKITSQERTMWMNMLKAGASVGSLAVYFDVSHATITSVLRGYREKQIEAVPSELRAEALRTQIDLKGVKTYTQDQLNNIRACMTDATFSKMRWNSSFEDRLSTVQANNIIHARHKNHQRHAHKNAKENIEQG
jgi:hypothetical protein